MILVFIVFFVIIQQRTIVAYQEKNENVLGEIKSVITKEVRLAEDANDGYSRVFFLPHSVNGQPYGIELNDTEIRISYSGLEKPLFLFPNVTNYSIGIGFNRISKINKKITIANENNDCGDGIVENPNFHYVMEECEKDSDCGGSFVCNISTCFCNYYG